MPFLYLLYGLLAFVAALPGKAEINPLTPVHLVAPDASMKAAFIPFGAITTNIWVEDKNGVFRDIILGFDNHTLYQSDADGHPYFGPIVGRYANRIRNGAFTIPISKDASGPGKKFFVPHNEGNNTLHGGPDGFDRRQWTAVKRSSNSVTFSLKDPNGTEGFPGTVKTLVTYTLEPKSTWKISIHATASASTPIMLSGHHYWNLEAYQESEDLNAHFAQFEASRFVETDGALIPTGKLTSVQGLPLDFRRAKSIGESIPATAAAQFCGTGCVGFDNCWLLDSVNEKKPAFSIWSNNSGIKLDIFTNQIAFQPALSAARQIESSRHARLIKRSPAHLIVPRTSFHAAAVFLAAAYLVNVIGIATTIYASPLYWRQEYHNSKLSGDAWVDELIHGHPDRVYTCNGIFNMSLPISRKASQGGPDAVYADHSCVVIEPESIVDAINNPEFGVNQIFGPDRAYDWESTYVFSTIH
ncbi:galactose mutarotase-like domain-containing protein [Gymnopilus junonius]|uniref:Galactose mutarotase-like domain-containing protein n=1 Tax=Gymnopilus junonius TaxID=109634 RepID=A0A9P5NVP2_GYMJU|nr:galactose mutarotase-like domain-containing protein [Gymnopilus junonius]